MAKGKGSAYERKICKQLSLWWTGGERDDVFWRSSNSGGRAKVRSRQGKGTHGQYGDIAATDPIGEALLQVFTIELKRGYSGDFCELIESMPTKRPKQWERFFRQVEEDTVNAQSMTWMLIWKRDRKEALLYTSALIIKRLADKGVELRYLPHLRGRVLLSDSHFLSVFACRVEDFLEAVKPEQIRSLLNDTE